MDETTSKKIEKLGKEIRREEVKSVLKDLKECLKTLKEMLCAIWDGLFGVGD